MDKDGIVIEYLGQLGPRGRGYDRDHLVSGT